MSDSETPAVTWTAGDDFVATVELRRPPNNFFSLDLIDGIANALFEIDDEPDCRAVVLCAEGKHFCAGADFGSGGRSYTTGDLYSAAVRVFRAQTPVVAAIQGAAIGGGLGLALSADFRVASPEARFSANFARLGFHQGFGLSETLPALVGQQKAAELLYTGRRLKGEEAAAIGMAHPKWDERPILVIVKKDGAEVSRETVLEYMKDKTAKWAMPDDVIFVDEIPHTATGKISKLTLREQLKDYVLPTA